MVLFYVKKWCILSNQGRIFSGSFLFMLICYIYIISESDFSGLKDLQNMVFGMLMGDLF